MLHAVYCSETTSCAWCDPWWSRSKSNRRFPLWAWDGWLNKTSLANPLHYIGVVRHVHISVEKRENWDVSCTAISRHMCTLHCCWYGLLQAPTSSSLVRCRVYRLTDKPASLFRPASINNTVRWCHIRFLVHSHTRWWNVNETASGVSSHSVVGFRSATTCAALGRGVTF